MKHAIERLTEESQKEFWASLALRHCPKMTPLLLRSLLMQYGSAYAVFTAATSPLTLHTKKTFPRDLSLHLKQEKWRPPALLEWREAKSFHGEIILWTDYRYPLELKHLIDAPAFFYAKGDISLLFSVCVSLVGSRKFHPETLEKTEEIAENLSHSGVCVVSGMAKGIDYAAHKGALRGIGKTIAVLGCGADIIYPIENRSLYHSILDSGLIISEFSPQTKPLAQNFPIRNRIVSGLSAALLVAEAQLKSGSLITARIALEQNRPVYTLKPLHEKHSLGTQNLIDDGAVQIEDALTILADIAPHLHDKLFLQTYEKNEFLQVSPSIKKHIHHKNDDTIKLDKLLQTHNKPAQREKNNFPIKYENLKVEDRTINKTKKSSTLKQIQKKEKDTKNPLYSHNYLIKTSAQNTNITKIDIDFKKITQELMGNRKNINIEDILKPKKKALSKTKKQKEAQKSCIEQETQKQDKEQTDKNINKTLYKDRSSLDSYEQKILHILETKSPLSPDDILLCLETSSISDLTTSLLILEVDSYVERISGNRYQLKSS